MNIMDKKSKKPNKFDMKDMKLFKIGIIALTLLIAKLWEPVLSLGWYWYALIFALAILKPLYKVLFK